jgi:S-adenosylmethionine:tRNA ribosyltransferase-isomerase
MNISEFDFEIPDELIAQEPPAERGTSRLLVLDRASGRVEHSTFMQLGQYLRTGDLLVVNNTQVIPARLLGTRVPSGGSVECLLIRRLADTHIGSDSVENAQFWEALMHPGQKLKVGARVSFERDGGRLHGEVLARHFHGRRTIRLWSDQDAPIDQLIDRIGHVPLPPYIKREDQVSDRDRYQAVYARHRGAVAAPTAGLHFTADLLDELSKNGIQRTEVTLHVGYGTFKPVRVERVEDHVVDAERYVVSATAAAALTRARRDGRRVVAVGTTTVRVLESLAIGPEGDIDPQQGQTSLFIHPGHEFRMVGGMITNFHLPRSSLLVLVSAFAGRDRVLAAYRDAVSRGYRFYSYGDAMLIV